jgi:RNA polymerase sigma-70 factor (ECF subfamily)
VQLFSFDHVYLERLKAGDTAVCRHFVSYFSELLQVKLRARGLRSDAADDVRQETFVRLFASLKRADGIRDGACLGAFVNSVCNNVLLEQFRSNGRTDALDDPPDPPDKALDMDGRLISEENQKAVRHVLAQLPAKDRRILLALFIQERDKDELCRQLGVDRNYFRVVLHRAKNQFREEYEKYLAAGAAH